MTELRHSRAEIRHQRYKYITKRDKLKRFLWWMEDEFVSSSKHDSGKRLIRCTCCPHRYRDVPRDKVVREYESF